MLLLASFNEFVFLTLCISTLGSFAILLLVAIFLIAFILDLDVENYVLGERVFNLQINLESLVEFG